MNAYIPQTVPTEIAYDLGAYTQRRQLTYLRRGYMEGGWEAQLVAAVRALLSDAAQRAMPCLDCSHNIYRDTIQRLCSRYEDPPEIRTGDLGDLTPKELFASHGEVEQAALAYNAAVVSLRWLDGELVVDVLPPDHCDIERDRAGRVARIRLARPIGFRGTSADFALEEWDLEKATYNNFESGRWVPQKEYPWRFEDGRPFAPVCIYRARRPPDFWGANRWPELIEATLEEGIAWTSHRYGRLNSSSGIPYILNATAVGQTPDDGGGGGVVQVVTGPNLVLQLTSEIGKQAAAGVLQATFDPEKDVRAIVAAYNARMASLGLGDNALQRGGPESGLAIIVRREGLLRLRNSTQTLFQRADMDYLEKVAAMSRIFGGQRVKGGPFAIEYAPVALGQADNKERRDQEKHDLDIGITSPKAIRAKRDGITLEEAEEAMQREGVAKPAAPSSPSPALQVAPAAAGGLEVVAGGAAVMVREPTADGPFVGLADFQGLKIDVEARAGETRTGTATDGSPWSTVMLYDYGEIRGTRGSDGDKLDAYIGPNHDSALVVLVNQHDPVTGAYDEQKVMLGFDSEEDAIAAYKAQYPSPGFYVEGDYEALTFGKFWRLVKDRKTRGKRIDSTDFA